MGFVAFLSSHRLASAGETTLAEPIVEENITDIDATEIGSLEVDLTGSLLRPSRTGANGTWTTGFEAEWRPIDRLGLGGELSTGGPSDGFLPSAPNVIGPRAAASYVFLRDQPRLLFLQAEIAGRWGPERGFAYGTESALPYTFGVRWATQLGPMTLRTAAMGEASGDWAHAPVRVSAAALAQIAGAPTRVYVGVELVADWARVSPFLAVPESLVLVRAFGKPIRVGVGIPLTIGARASDAAYGIVFRFVLEPDD